jgi:hypothetical protein
LPTEPFRWPPIQAFPVFAACALLSLTLGCAGHTRQSYNLVEIDSQYFLAPSGAAIEGQHQEVQISLGPSKPGGIDAGRCAIHGQWFSFYPSESASESWTVESPTAQAWAQAGGHVDLKPEWDHFLSELAARQQKQCFPATADFTSIKQKIVAGMAMPIDESLLYRYSYGEEGYADLSPGMELRIERNIRNAETATASAQTKGNPLRTITTSYDFRPANGSDVQINFLRSQDTSPSEDFSALGLPDETLAATFNASTHLRLILQHLEVTAGTKSPAILLGGAAVKDLDAATSMALGNPDITCEDLQKFHVACVRFNGLVTVSPVLKVTVNGRPTDVPLGSKVWYLFPPSPGSAPKILRTLKIRRLADGQFRELQFRRTEDDVGQILLFGGDEISWSRSKSTPKHD